jgi:hypothetical protein
MSQPNAKQFAIHKANFPNAVVKTVDPIAGCLCVKGDIVPHPAYGWHVAIAGTSAQPVAYPGSGLKVGESNDSFHYAVGPSYTGTGLPQTGWSGTSDNPSSFATDGRRTSADGTIGGAVGVVTGGISNQSSGAGNTGDGGGSSTRGF